MNKNIKNTVIGLVALAIIIIGVKMAMSSKDSENLVLDTSTASSTVVSVVSSPTDSNTVTTNGQKTDANGCITDANYVWDTKIGSCVHISKVSSSTLNASIKNPSTTTKISDAMAQHLCNSKGGQWSEKVRECLGVDKNVCQSIGGQFNECASACRNNPEAEICTMQCVQVCSIK